MMNVARGMLGIVALIFIAWLLSSNRRRFPWKTVISGLILQWILAMAVLWTETGRAFFDVLGRMVAVVLRGAEAGSRFVFMPFGGDRTTVPWFANVGVTILSTIIIVAALSSLGYHYGILQRVVAAMAWVMKRFMNLSGAESLSGAANVFLGQTEAPLLVRPYLSSMTESEIMSVMTCGFSTVAAGVMAVYINMLGGGDSERALMMARHVMTACLMTAPAGFIMAKVMVPETGHPATEGSAKIVFERQTRNLVDALTTGASDGVMLAINVLAMLIAFIALVSIIDQGLTWLGHGALLAPVVQKLGMKELNLDGILGLVFAPMSWLLGVEWTDCRAFGGLLGKAMATNELIAYQSLADLIANKGMHERSIIMATYSLCGFANLSSIGIQIGGIGALAPDRRADLVRLGPRAMLGGAMACWMTGCIAGMLVT